MSRSTLGGYLLEERIAVGGMAEVFRARRVGAAGFERRVAIKRVLPHLARDERFIQMLREEARLAAGLSCSNLVQVFDFGEEDGECFLVMELVDGVDLASLLARCGPLEAGVAVHLGRELCVALEHLHGHLGAGGAPAQIVHRDVTPGNVLLSAGGEVKLGDLGIAKAAASAVRTDTGTIKGKLAYLSPEQVRGDAVDARTDLYGLGLVLFEALTGQRYLDAPGEAQLLRLAEHPRFRPPSKVSACTPRLDALLERLLAPEMERRPPGARMVSEALVATGCSIDSAAGRAALAGLVRRTRGTDRGAAEGRAQRTTGADQVAAAARAQRTTGTDQDAAAGRAQRTTGADQVAAVAPAQEEGRSASASVSAPPPSGRTVVLADERRRVWLRPALLLAVGLTTVAAGIAAVSWASHVRPATAPEPRAAEPAAVEPQESAGALAPSGVPAAERPPAVVRPAVQTPRTVRVAPAPEKPSPPVTAPPAPEAQPPAAPDPLAVARRQLSRIDGVLAQKGLLRDDVPALSSRLSALREALGQGAVAEADLDELEADAAAVVVDRAFVGAKLQRVNQRLATAALSADSQVRVKQHSRSALSHLVDGRFDTANAELNEICRLLER